jgi:putative phosphoesterase
MEISFPGYLAVLIAVLSDTHLPRGARRIPERCLEVVRGADLAIHAGDFVAESVLDELRSLGPPIVAVHGNVDCEGLRRALPRETVVDAEGASIAVVHDGGPSRGRAERLRRLFPEADAVVFGHSHLPLHETHGGVQIFNPGSPTERRRSPRHTMGLALAREGSVAFEHLALD